MMNRILLSFMLILSCTLTQAQVLHTGAMRNVMWKGQLQATVQIDSLLTQPHLYAIGPLDSLQGELLVWDGIPYTARLNNAQQMSIGKDSLARSPFLVYDYVKDWDAYPLPDTVRDLKSLELFLTQFFKDEPFLFRLESPNNSARIHVVNLPAGSVVKSPEDAHRGRAYFEIQGPIKALGVYSNRHQGIYTHHDSRLHIHLLTANGLQMGHLDTWTGSGGVVWVARPY